MSRSFLIGLALLAGLSTFLTACAPVPIAPVDPPWRYVDVRRLDAVDDDLPAECDLIATYLRLTDDELQLRLDFLEPFSQDCVLWVTANGQSGGQRRLPDGSDAGMDWDMLLTFSSDTIPLAQLSGGADAPFIPRIIADRDSASVVVHINRRRLPFRPEQMQFSAFSRMNDRTIDSISTFSLSESPPPRAPMLWLFSSVLQPDTAQTARSGWDAAHAGPAGSRFGLRHLLKSASASRIPIVLLDVRRPSVLSALDALGGTHDLSRMINAGLLLAPDVVSSAAGGPTASRDLNRRISQSLGIPSSPFAFGDLSGTDLQSNTTYFADLSDGAHLAKLNGSRLIPLPSTPTAALDANGVTPNALRRLLSAALSADPGDLVFFHEALPESFAGDTRSVARGMAYLATHPWIQPLSAADLQTWPARTLEQLPCATLFCADAPDASSPIAADLQVNSAGDWARILAEDPSTGSLSPSMRAAHIAGLTLSARWLANPQPIAACGLDLDQDQREDCLLANDQTLMVATIADTTPTILAMRILPGDNLILLFTPPHNPNADLSAEITAGQIVYHASGGSLHSRWAIQSSPPALVLEAHASDLTLTFTAAGMQRFTSGWAQRHTPNTLPGGWQLGPLSITATSPAATLECGFTPLDRLRQPQDPESAEPAAFSLPLDSCQLRIPSGSLASFTFTP